MKIGWIGLGKLGLPCALALEDMGKHDIVGYDIHPLVRRSIETRVPLRPKEEGLEQLLSQTKLKSVTDVDDVVVHTDRFIFMAVQTPHHPDYGGERPMPVTTVDFDYEALRRSVTDVAYSAIKNRKHVTIVIISTALPGTVEREILPLLNDNVTVVYNPFFIAMGTTIDDFRNPEFVLIGAQSEEDAEPLIDFYDDLYECGVPIMPMTLAEAELTKVAYNTFISMKIVFANTLLEISDKLGIDVDAVTSALQKADRRLTSGMYMTGGVGDGGACHPRDNIAMSWLAEKLDLSVDPFDFVTRARELQSRWLVDRVIEESVNANLPIIVMGKSYKPNSDLMHGSPAALLTNQLLSHGFGLTWWDPHFDAPLDAWPAAVYVVMTKHDVFEDFEFPTGSIVIDPHRFIPEWDGVRVIALGGGA